MKLRMFLSGLLFGLALGLLIGGAIVKISPDDSNKRQYPQGLALLLGLIGGVAGGSALRIVPNQNT